MMLLACVRAYLPYGERTVRYGTVRQRETFGNLDNEIWDLGGLEAVGRKGKDGLIKADFFIYYMYLYIFLRMNKHRWKEGVSFQLLLGYLPDFYFYWPVYSTLFHFDLI